jgi:hypothetical protein
MVPVGAEKLRPENVTAMPAALLPLATFEAFLDAVPVAVRGLGDTEAMQ